jgi:hypothetical protein
MIMKTSKTIQEVEKEVILRKRLFIGVFPTGLSYADQEREEHGDYKKLAFLSFDNLKLEIYEDCPEELKPLITQDAQEIIARKGEEYRVSLSGQTVILGYALPASSMFVDCPVPKRLTRQWLVRYLDQCNETLKKLGSKHRFEVLEMQRKGRYAMREILLLPSQGMTTPNGSRRFPREYTVLNSWFGTPRECFVEFTKIDFTKREYSPKQ